MIMNNVHSFETRTSAAILCCVGPSEHGIDHVRAAAALAARWGCRWHAVSIQSRRLGGFGDRGRVGVSRSLHLAASLGARTDLMYAENVADVLVRYARDHAITTILIGKGGRRARWPAESLVAQIVRQASDLEVRRIDKGQVELTAGPGRPLLGRRAQNLIELLLAVTVVMCASMLESANALRASSVALLMVLAVALVALRGGRRAAAATTLLNLLIFDYFVIPPHYSLQLKDVQSLVTFLVMLTVGLTIGELTARLRAQARAAAAHEQRAYLLSTFSRNLSAQMGQVDVLQVGAEMVSRTFDAAVEVLLLSEQGDLEPMHLGNAVQAVDVSLVHRALREGRGCGNGTSIEPRNDWLVLPLRTSTKDCGVMALKPTTGAIDSGQLHEIETFASLIALALERVRYLGLAQEAMLGVESERLRSSLLAALSHDLQTPLASVVGLADSVLLTKPTLSEQQQEMISAIVEEGSRMSNSVGNLLEMAKLESGRVRLRRDWHSVEEVIGTALAATRRRLGTRTRHVRVPPDLPLASFDAALIERVVINLLDNASKYTAPDAVIEIEASARSGHLDLSITDDGPGLPVGREDALFAKFARARNESAGSGVGLGLAICRAIVAAHGGEIYAESGRARGARFIMSLPLSEAPAIFSETEMTDHV
jgi:two-component system sensor histidine kinase KdpD